jgi:hypothetical protein
MKIKAIILGCIFGLVALPAFAQVAPPPAINTTSTATSGSNSGAASQASNGGVSVNNTSSVPANQALHYSGSYAILAAPSVGMGSYAGSMSSDYCAGTSQTSLSLPGIGFGHGAPVVDQVCQKLRAVERTYQMSNAFGNSAVKNLDYGQAMNKIHPYESMVALKVGYEDAKISNKLALAGINIMCSLGPSIYKAYTDAGISCPKEPEHQKKD